MIRAAFLLVAMMASAPVHAAGEGSKSSPEPVDAEAPADTIPRSMVPQGVIGRTDSTDGISLLDPDVLVAMRRRLIDTFGTDR